MPLNLALSWLPSGGRTGGGGDFGVGLGTFWGVKVDEYPSMTAKGPAKEETKHMKVKSETNRRKTHVCSPDHERLARPFVPNL